LLFFSSQWLFGARRGEEGRPCLPAGTNDENDYKTRIPRMVTNGSPFVSFTVISGIRYFLYSLKDSKTRFNCTSFINTVIFGRKYIVYPIIFWEFFEYSISINFVSERACH